VVVLVTLSLAGYFPAGGALTKSTFQSRCRDDGGVFFGPQPAPAASTGLGSRTGTIEASRPALSEANGLMVGKPPPLFNALPPPWPWLRRACWKPVARIALYSRQHPGVSSFPSRATPQAGVGVELDFLCLSLHHLILWGHRASSAPRK